MDEELPPVKNHNFKAMLEETKSTIDSSCYQKLTQSGLALSNKGSHEYLEPISVSSDKL